MSIVTLKHGMSPETASTITTFDTNKTIRLSCTNKKIVDNIYASIDTKPYSADVVLNFEPTIQRGTGDTVYMLLEPDYIGTYALYMNQTCLGVFDANLNWN